MALASKHNGFCSKYPLDRYPILPCNCKIKILKRHTTLVNTVIFTYLFLKDFIYFQREREGEREGMKYQRVFASHVVPPLGTWPATQACALTGNQTSDPLVHRPVLNPLSHTSQGLNTVMFKFMLQENLSLNIMV